MSEQEQGQEQKKKKKGGRKEMTVNNVNALSPFGTVQGSQTSVKPEEVVQERFDKLMNKMSDQLTSLQKAQAGSSVAATASKQAVAESVKSAQETAQPKDALRQDGAAEAQKPGEARMGKTWEWKSGLSVRRRKSGNGW